MMRRAACIVGLLLATDASAQTQLYQSDLRSQFERGVDRPEPMLGWFVQPRIESALYMVKNINLAQQGSGVEEIDLAGIEVVPGIYASYNSPRARGFLDYSLIGRMWEDSDFNELYNRLTTSGDYLIAPDWLRIGGQATYSNGVVDPTQSFNYGGMGVFDPTNSNERLAASVSPEFFHQFRDFRLDARYTYGRVWYLDSQAEPSRLVYSLYQDDSIDQSANVSLSTNQDNEFTARLYYDWQFSDFQTTVDYKYERAGIDLGARLSRTLRAVGDYGLESDLDKSTTDGGLDSSFWHVGLAWTPDTRTNVEARYGQRFFGDSWSLNLSRDTRWVTVRLSYIEDPTVETRRIGINFDPNEIPLPVPGDELSGFTSFPYIRKDFVATVIAEGARTRIRLTAYDRNRDYIRVFPPDEHRKGATLAVVYDFGAYIYGEVQTRYDDIESGRRNLTLPDIEDQEFIYHYYDWDIVGRLSWEAYENFITSGEVGYLNRSGTYNYDGAWVAFRLRYTF
jgi:uncharacterized protein (PEP-CTERM system associated)